MQFGAHLPSIDFRGEGWTPSTIPDFVDAARDAGFSALCANDHFVYQRPWLDGIVALASVIERSGRMDLVTTVALPLVRGPHALAKAAAALDILSGARLILGVGPGSSARDHALVGLDFEERWQRLDESVKVLRAYLRPGSPPFAGRFYNSTEPLEPRPSRPEGLPIWIGSWGSDAGLRRVARLGDGWLASGYNTTPNAFAVARQRLAGFLAERQRDIQTFPCSLATLWTYVTDDASAAQRQTEMIAKMLNRPVDQIAEQVLIGPAETCVKKLTAYATAGVDNAYIWPLADGPRQLELFAARVAPLV